MLQLSSWAPRRLTGISSLALFFLVTIGLALWLGYEALAAAASHRRTAEAVLLDYARISATELARVARGDLDDVLDEAFESVENRARFGGEATPNQILRQMDDAARDQGCDCPSLRDPLFAFRIDPGPRSSSIQSVRAAPDTISLATRARLVELLAVAALDAEPGEERVTVVGEGDFLVEPVAIGWVMSEQGDGPEEPVFGFVASTAALSELFQEWYDDRQLLPQPIAGDAPNDSLLYVTVEGPGGVQVFASPTPYSTALAAEASVGPEMGDLVVTAAVRPDAASQLIIGGLPNARLPLLVLLLLLTLGVGAATFVQLRREQGFQRLREDFVSGVSHELRTPLAQIRMFSELQEAGKLLSPADQKRAVTVVAREARRLSHLVDNILQFSALARTRGRGIPREPIDLAEAAAEGVDSVRPLLADRGMKLDFAADGALSVLGNREAIARVLVNLLDNAAKYGPREQTVQVSVERVGHLARITVEDEGPGVPSPDRNRVFNAYTRLDRDVKARIPGSGIGLSVVRELTSLHGGRVWVEDAESGGARFVVELPTVQVVADEGHGAPGARGNVPESATGSERSLAERTR